MPGASYVRIYFCSFFSNVFYVVTTVVMCFCLGQCCTADNKADGSSFRCLAPSLVMMVALVVDCKHDKERSLPCLPMMGFGTDI